MKLSLLLAATSVAASVPLSSVQRVNNGNLVPSAYVVEMTSTQSLAGKRAFASRHAELYHSMKKRGLAFEVEKEYNTPEIFVGASITLSPLDVAAVAALPEVQAIRPVVIIPGPKPINLFTVQNPDDKRLADPLSTHLMTGVDKVHAQGIFGKGIKIGIIDSGIDYNHPALGGAFGPGNKVAGGYDFVGDNGSSPDEDPSDNCNGHGTHVAGIIGADPDNEFKISGVAYEATLNAYRVFGCTGGASDQTIIDALLRAYEDGNDVLNLSLGGPSGWSESSSAIVASRIAQAGRVVAISAGNDGSYGSWYASSPATGIDAISVASVDNIIVPVQNATVGGVEHNPISYLSALPLPTESGPLLVYATSNDTTQADDACTPLPASTPDLSERLVLLHRGTCSFVTKLDNAAAFGAKTFLIYNTDTGAFSAIGVGEYTAALISAEDGKFLVEQIAAGVPITLSFPIAPASIPNPVGGLMSSFSTYGPTFEAGFKPALAAPGGSILSTYPLALGGYAVESGTSMSAPFTAGSAALILQAKGLGAAKSVRDLLQSTSSVVSSSNTDDGPIQTVSQQGSGLIQVFAAINTKTIITPAQFALNDTANFNGKQTFTITNQGKKAVTYKITHETAGTAQSVTTGSILPSVGPVPLTTADVATVKLSKTSVTVKPGKTEKVTVTFKAPTNAPETFPVYSGFINVASADETLKVTYLGIAASLRDKAVIDTTDVYFGIPLPALLDAAGEVAVNSTTYTLEGGDFPTLLYRLAFGTPKLLVDIVDKDIKIKNVLAREIDGWWSTEKHQGTSTFAKVKTVGALGQADYIPRNSLDPDATRNPYDTLVVDGTFANGAAIPNGEYKVLLRALKVTGDERKQEDYESWLSPVIVIARA